MKVNRTDILDVRSFCMFSVILWEVSMKRKKQKFKGVIGIYKIENKVNGKKYIGQSIDIGKRWSSHCTMLKYNKHTSVHLQGAYNFYGEESFSFSVLEECGEDKLDERERYWIAYYNATNPEYGYNVLEGGYGPEREKKWGENGGVSKINEQTALMIIERLKKGEFCRIIAKSLGVSESIVLAIRQKSTWKYLTNGVEFPRRCSTEYYGVMKRGEHFIASVRYNRKTVFSETRDTAYEAMLCREKYLRLHPECEYNRKNLPDDVDIDVPERKRFYGVYISENNKYWKAIIRQKYSDDIKLGYFTNSLSAAIYRELYIRENENKLPYVKRNFQDYVELKMPPRRDFADFREISSKYYGVAFEPRSGMWLALVNSTRYRKQLGRFKNEYDAMMCREYFAMNHPELLLKRNLDDDMVVKPPVSIFSYGVQYKRGVYEIYVMCNNKKKYIGRSKDLGKAVIARERYIRENADLCKNSEHNFSYELSIWQAEVMLKEGGLRERIDENVYRNPNKKTLKGTRLKKSTCLKLASISEAEAKEVVRCIMNEERLIDISKKLNISYAIVSSIYEKRSWSWLSEGVEFPLNKSSKYYGVSYNSKTHRYMAKLNVDKKEVFHEVNKNEYYLAVKRELFIREYYPNNRRLKHNFPDDMELVLPDVHSYKKSKYFGLAWLKQVNGWGEFVQVAGKSKYLGYNKDEFEAASHREKWINEHHDLCPRAKMNFSKSVR